MGHAVPQVPQFAASVWVLVHWPLHTVWPLAQPHCPALQLLPPVQALPQVPQFALSVCVLTQAPAHDVCPAPQTH